MGIGHQCAFVGVGAADIDTAVFFAAWTDLDDASRAGLGAYAAAHAFVGVNDGKPRDRVDVKRAEITFLHAVA